MSGSMPGGPGNRPPVPPPRGGAGNPPSNAPPGAPPPPGDTFSERIRQTLQRRGGADGQEPAGGDSGLRSGPVGQGNYIVRPGDCMSSIANVHGFFWQTLWNDPGNQELKTIREDPNLLLPGDRVTIPDKRRKDESLAPETRHRFKRKGEPAKFRVRLLDGGEPLRNKPYTAKVDGDPAPAGTTDSNGSVEIPIPGKSRRIEILVSEGDEQWDFVFELGDLAPPSTLRGVQQRLRSLGYSIEEISEQMDDATRRALFAFQGDNGLEQSGEPDEPTRAKLEEVYGG